MAHNHTNTAAKFERIRVELEADMDRVDVRVADDLRWSLIFLEKCISTLKKIRIKIVP